MPTYVILIGLKRGPTPNENICFDLDVFITCLLGSTTNARCNRAVALRELLTTLPGVRDLVISFFVGVI